MGTCRSIEAQISLQRCMYTTAVDHRRVFGDILMECDHECIASEYVSRQIAGAIRSKISVNDNLLSPTLVMWYSGIRCLRRLLTMCSATYSKFKFDYLRRMNENCNRQGYTGENQSLPIPGLFLMVLCVEHDFITSLNPWVCSQVLNPCSVRLLSLQLPTPAYS